MFEHLPQNSKESMETSENRNDFDFGSLQYRDDYSNVSSFEFFDAQDHEGDLSSMMDGVTDSVPQGAAVRETLNHFKNPQSDRTDNQQAAMASSNKTAFIKAAAEMVRQAVMQGDTFEAAMNTTKRSFRQQDQWVFSDPQFTKLTVPVQKSAGLLGPVFISPSLYSSCSDMRREADKVGSRPQMVLATSRCSTCPLRKNGMCMMMSCPIGGRRMLASRAKDHRRKVAAEKPKHQQKMSTWQPVPSDVFEAPSSHVPSPGPGPRVKKAAASFLKGVFAKKVGSQEARRLTASSGLPHEDVVRLALSVKGLKLSPSLFGTSNPRRALASLGVNPHQHGDLVDKLARCMEGCGDKTAEMYKEVPSISEPVTNPIAETMTSMDMAADPLPLTAEDVMGAVVGYVAQELGQQPQNDMEIDTTPMSCGDEELIPRIAAPGRPKKKKKKVQLNPDGSERGYIAKDASVADEARVSADSRIEGEAHIHAWRKLAPEISGGSKVRGRAYLTGKVIVENGATIEGNAILKSLRKVAPIIVTGPNVKITGGTVVASKHPIYIGGEAHIKDGDVFRSDDKPLDLKGGYGRGGEDIYIDGYDYDDELEEYPDPPERPDLVLSADQLNRAFRGEPAILPDGVETIPIERTKQFLEQMSAEQSFRELVDLDPSEIEQSSRESRERLQGLYDLAPSEDEWSNKMTFNSKFDLWNVIRYVSWSLKKAGKQHNYGTDPISSSFLDEAIKKQTPSKKVPAEDPTLLVRLIQKYARIDDPRKVSFKIKTGNHRHAFPAKRSGSRIASGNHEQNAQYLLKLMEAEDIARELAKLSQEEF